MQNKLGVKNLSELRIEAIKGKCNTKSLTKEPSRKYKRFGKELINGEKDMYIREDLALPIIMGCTKPKAIKFRTKLGFNHQDLIMTKEESVLTKMIKVFSSERILLQHYVLDAYRIDLYFTEHKLAVEVNKRGQKDRYEYKENERENAIKEHLGCKFFRINSDEKDFDTFIDIGKICNHIKKS